MSFVSAVPGQMTHFVASLTLDSAKSYVMQSASCTQRKDSSVPFVFSTPFVLSPDFVSGKIGLVHLVHGRRSNKIAVSASETFLRFFFRARKSTVGGYLSDSAMLMSSTKGFENLIASGL
ncbi:hypothetical protein Tco_1201981 [Tanacetum coccineum]